MVQTPNQNALRGAQSTVSLLCQRHANDFSLMITLFNNQQSLGGSGAEYNWIFLVVLVPDCLILFAPCLQFQLGKIIWLFGRARPFPEIGSEAIQSILLAPGPHNFDWNSFWEINCLIGCFWYAFDAPPLEGFLLSREQTYPLFWWKKCFFGYVSCCEHRLW